VEEGPKIDLASKKAKIAILAALAIAGAISFICGSLDSNYGIELMSLQHLGTLLLTAPLVCDCFKNRMPMSAFAGVAVFAAVHIVGARWCYSNVPYMEWCESLRPCLPDGFFTGRNHYDRFVHFSFGFFMFPYLLHASRKWTAGKPVFAAVMAWLLVQTGSMIYELFEWQLAVFMSPGDADLYNGQQGDMWDAQKDMALAMAGATIPAVFCAIKSMREKKTPSICARHGS